MTRMSSRALIPLACVTLIYGCAQPISQPAPPAGSFTLAKVALALDGVSETTTGAAVTADFFPAVNVPPILGRQPLPADWAPGAQRVVLLSEELWRRRFSASPEIIGKIVEIDGASAIVVGIMPRTFEVPAGATLWFPR